MNYKLLKKGVIESTFQINSKDGWERLIFPKQEPKTLNLRKEVPMQDILKIIQERHSARMPFDPERSIDTQDLRRILEAGR